MDIRNPAQIAIEVKMAIEQSRQNLQAAAGGGEIELGAAVNALSGEISVLAQAVMELAAIAAQQQQS